MEQIYTFLSTPTAWYFCGSDFRLFFIILKITLQVITGSGFKSLLKLLCQCLPSSRHIHTVLGDNESIEDDAVGT